MRFQDLLQQVQIPFGGFRGGEPGRKQGRGGVVNGGQEATGGMAFPEPWVRAAVPLDHLAQAFLPLSPAAVFGGTASSFRRKPRAPQDLSHRFASQGDSFAFPEELGEVGIIGVRVPLRMELDDAVAGIFVEGIGGRSPTIPVDQTFPIGMNELCFESFGLPVARPDQRCGRHQGHPSFRNLPEHPHPLELSTAHSDYPLHGHPLCRGDIFPWQYEGT